LKKGKSEKKERDGKGREEDIFIFLGT